MSDRLKLVLALVHVLALSISPAGCGQGVGDPDEITVRITMEDGIRLEADVYLPGPGQHPVVLVMSPYGRRGEQRRAEALRSRGYAVVVQDVRGRYGSEGDFDPIHQEKTDGPSTVDWITAQDWYDPELGIAIIGSCYQTTVGLATAARRREVRAMVSIGGLTSLYDLAYRGGARIIHHALPWTIITSASPQPSLAGIDWLRVFRTDPVDQAALAAGFHAPLWEAWAGQPSESDPYWARLGVAELLAEVDIPILHVSGWYDIDLGSALTLYGFFVEHASSPQALVLGPWSHRTVLGGESSLQGVDFGPEGDSDIFGRTVDWLEHFLRGRGPDSEAMRFVRVFVTGANRWLDLPAWPTGEKLNLFLDGYRLTDRFGEQAASRCYEYDPADPVPTLGGNVWHFSPPGLDPGPADQSPLHSRPDVLVYASEVLEEPLVVAGPVEVELWVSSDAATTDFTAKLVDLSPDGEARYLADGIIRSFMDQGQVRRLSIDLWAVAHRFPSGHRVGLEVASSSFPKFDLNPTTITGRPRQSRPCVHSGPEYPSRVRIFAIE